MTSILGLFLVLIGTLMYLFGLLFLRKNQLNLDPIPNAEPRFAFLIPARDESAVIEGLLNSLKKQTVPVSGQDIYVIVESKFDPTVEICRKFGAQIMFRRDLTKQRKGYALDDAVKNILSQNQRYDLFFIFDVDNIVEKNYLAEMIKTYQQGYKIATGYRNTKNGNQNVIAAASSLTFSMINAVSNRRKIQNRANVVFSGTGCYVSGDLIRDWQGWPFHSLTEDYEMSLYATLHALPTFYNEHAVFFDEQPLKYRATANQRVRWIRGYFESRREFLPHLKKVRSTANNYGSVIRERIGVTPLILVLIGLLIAILGLSANYILYGNFIKAFFVMLLTLGGVYIFLWFVTLYIIRHEKLNLSRTMKLKVLFFNPLYLLTYVPCAIKAILQKEVTWKKIPHGKKS